MFTHFLQTKTWQACEELEGHKTFYKESENYTYLAIKKPTKVGSYLFVPYGPSIKAAEGPTQAEKSFQEALESLVSLARQESCVFIRLEPTEPLNANFLQKQGLIKTKDIDPADTWLLDLTPSREDLLHGMSQGTRTRYNQFSKKGLSIETTKDPERISELTRLQHKLAGEKGISPYEEAHLKAELSQPFSTLYLVHYTDPEDNKDKIIAASLFFDDEKNSTRFYMQSAADSTYKKLPATAGLLSTAIFDAKEKSLKFFDFWGIAPEGAPEDHPWAGFTVFKKSFGGFAKSYSGTYDFVLNKQKYNLYKVLRKLNRKIRKI